MGKPFSPLASIEGDSESVGLIYEGANRSQLKQLFKVDLAKVNEACTKVAPTGKRHGAAIWKIHEVAPHIVKAEIPADQIAEHIRKMNPQDLPMMLRREFWVGEKARQEVMLKAGDLWPTGKVIQHVGEMLKLIRMNTQLMLDAVERQSELTPQQIAIIKSLTDGMLSDLKLSIRETFSQPLEDPDASEEI